VYKVAQSMLTAIRRLLEWVAIVLLFPIRLPLALLFYGRHAFSDLESEDD